MCETYAKRQYAIRALALNLTAAQIQEKRIREVYKVLKVKDIEVLDKLDKAMAEAIEYLAGELEGEE